jgi:hypothetical protein
MRMTPRFFSILVHIFMLADWWWVGSKIKSWNFEIKFFKKLNIIPEQTPPIIQLNCLQLPKKK